MILLHFIRMAKKESSIPFDFLRHLLSEEKSEIRRSINFHEAPNSAHKENHELPLQVDTRAAGCTASRGEARSMESGIIADVDRLKESRRGDPLPYLCNERSPCVSCLRPRPEHTHTHTHTHTHRETENLLLSLLLPTLLLFPLATSTEPWPSSWCSCDRCP